MNIALMNLGLAERPDLPARRPKVHIANTGKRPDIPLDQRLASIIALLSQADATTRDIHETLFPSLSERTVKRDLCALRQAGRIESYRAGPRVYWELTGQ